MRSARCARLSPSFAVPAALVLVALGGLAGCRSGSALHRRYDNFRAYYNTYYNATQKLEEGERALLNGNTPVDRARLVELFPTGAETSGRTPVFDEAIEKSAELLRHRPNSRWADDALLVIGKAYFYERNFVGAEQKFRETMAAAEIASDRELADEARFWLGRTMAAADRYDEGVLVLREALERPDGDRYWQARMHLALGELYARAGRWDASTVSLRDGIAGIRDADLAARAALLLGQVEEAAGRYDAASEAYQTSLGRRPAYEISFAAELNRALVLGLDGGRSEDGLALVRSMRRDDKNYARRAEVALAEARILAAAGTADEAESLFRDVLYDQALAGQGVRGEAHYRLAEFYRDVLGDYVTAAAHFDTAATAIPAPPSVAERPSRAAIVGVQGLATTFETVARTSRRISAIDSLLELGTLDEDAFQARIAEIESVRRAEWVQQRREADALRTAQDFGGQGASTTPFGGDPGLTGTVGRDAGIDGTDGPDGTTPGSAAAGVSVAANGFLGYRDPRTVQSGLLSFQRIYGDRPLVPNWRRRSAVQGGAVASGVGLGQTDAEFAPGLNGLAGPPPLDVSGIPRTPEEQDVLITERASLRYELANTFFLSLARADRAGVLYRQILDETPDAPVAARARYALAELESGEGRIEAAAPLYRDVADSDSLGALGLAARARLEGREPVAAAPVLDDQTEADYAAARRVWDDGDPYGAAVALVALGSADPDAEGAPRNFFAAALAYADWARADSLALIAPLPPELVPEALVGAEPQAVQEEAAAPDAAAPVFDDELVRPRDRRARPTRAPAPVAPAPVVPAAPAPVGTTDTDAGGLVSDSLAAVLSDSLAVAPPAGSAADTTGLDLALPTDSLAVADSVSAPAFTLRDYLSALAARYPGTAYASRALAMAAGLPEPVAPDTTAAPPPAVELAAEFSGFQGDAPIDVSVGGVSWQIGPFASRADAEERLASLPARSLRTAIATDGTSFVVLLGQFVDDAAAVDAAVTADPALLAEAAVAPVEGFALVGPPEEAVPAPPVGAPTTSE